MLILTTPKKSILRNISYFFRDLCSAPPLVKSESATNRGIGPIGVNLLVVVWCRNEFELSHGLRIGREERCAVSSDRRGRLDVVGDVQETALARLDADNTRLSVLLLELLRPFVIGWRRHQRVVYIASQFTRCRR